MSIDKFSASVQTLGKHAAFRANINLSVFYAASMIVFGTKRAFIRRLKKAGFINICPVGAGATFNFGFTIAHFLNMLSS